MKKYLIGILCVSWVSLCSAQDMFWNFDDDQNPLPIPAECDARFDEIRGGVFMPTTDEMYEFGMGFIKNNSLTVQQRGAYCLLGAALQGHPDAQLEVSKMYEDGRILPQSDLSAYKWAFIAALNGNKAAEKITLLLEQLLTTEDLEQTTGAIDETRREIQENLRKKAEEERQQAAEDAAKLNGMNDTGRVAAEENGNDHIVPLGEAAVPQADAPDEAAPKVDPAELLNVQGNVGNIFNDEDRMK